MKKLLLLLITLLVFTTTAFSQELEKPVEGKAKVYVFSYGGSIIRTPVLLFLDKEVVGKLNTSMLLDIDLAPGEYVLWSKNANRKWFIKLNVVADKTYYVHLQATPPRFPGIDTPVLHNACPNHRKGKKRYKQIAKRLANDKFVIETVNTPEYLSAVRLEQEATIAEVWAMWENEWSANKKWQQISPEDGE